jgi:hypothetical protein
MSGPKYSCISANLGVIIKAYTRGELEVVLARVEEAERALNVLDEKIMSLINSFSSFIYEAIKLEAFSSNKKALSEAKKIIEDAIKNSGVDLLESRYDYSKDIKVKTGADVLDKHREINNIWHSLIKLREQTIVFANNDLKKLANRYKIDYKVEEKTKEVKDFKTNKKVVEDINVKLILLPEDFFEQDQISKDELTQINEKLDKIEYYINYTHMKAYHQQELENVFSTIKTIMDYDVSSKEKISMINAEYDNFLHLIPNIESADKKYNEILASLEIIKKNTGVDYSKYGFIDSLEEIEAVYAKVEKDFNEVYKEQYISESIKEVMRDFGYDVLRSEVLKSDNNQSYFDYDGSSAISIYRNEDGAMVMELVATGDESELTENEATVHLEKMRRFCDKYPKLLEEIKKKGIEIEQQAEMPVDKAFVRKVATRKGRRVQYQEQKRYLG